ncbi:MAG TPA: hypothetical protein DDY98_06600 [Ruminococcaceae bacterium]|nr:hypothetical protein [Oscillospiraceae bacterium]
MKLLVLVLNKTECLGELLTALLNAELRGATVIDSQGMLRVIDEDTVEPPPIFGMLRKYMTPSHEMNKTVFIVLPDEKIDTARRIINEVTGGIDKPNTGIMFAVPLSFVEGIN